MYYNNIKYITNELFFINIFPFQLLHCFEYYNSQNRQWLYGFLFFQYETNTSKTD